MGKAIVREIPMSPEFVIERMREETVPFKTLTDISRPLHSYGSFIVESLTGGKLVSAKIDGNRFSLFKVGHFPFKGPIVGPPMGTMAGVVEECKSGSQISARYKIYPVWIAFIGFLVLLIALVSCGGAVLYLFGENVDGRYVLMATSLVVDCVLIGMIAYMLICAKLQSAFASRFLDQFAVESSQAKQANV